MPREKVSTELLMNQLRALASLAKLPLATNDRAGLALDNENRKWAVVWYYGRLHSGGVSIVSRRYRSKNELSDLMEWARDFLTFDQLKV